MAVSPLLVGGSALDEYAARWSDPHTFGLAFVVAVADRLVSGGTVVQSSFNLLALPEIEMQLGLRQCRPLGRGLLPKVVLPLRLPWHVEGIGTGASVWRSPAHRTYTYTTYEGTHCGTWLSGRESKNQRCDDSDRCDLNLHDILVALRSNVTLCLTCRSVYQTGTRPTIRYLQERLAGYENARTNIGGQGVNRTLDTRIFSPLLYRLSYLPTVLVRVRGEANLHSYR
jgi:hypothetical protein